MHDRTTPIADFLAATAARHPTPGGGSVAALTGALSAAIGEMVLNYSVGRKDAAAVEPQLRHVAAELARAREVLLQLMVDDQEAYADLTAVRKLPAGAPERVDRLPATVLACVRGPQAVAATAVAVLGLCDQVVDHVNPWLLSDLAVCADLATATVRAAGYNVRVNLPSVDDVEGRQRLAAETEQLWSHALSLVQRVSPRIWARDAALRSRS
jgi:formiminotetrahydrofolate cyclodeaminase